MRPSGLRWSARFEAKARDIGSAIGRNHIDPRVLEVIQAIPRHEFVPENLRDASYADRPLPIGYGQTISQPFIVALMTDVLSIDHSGVVLEVGTGSGYQAAVVGELAHQIYTIEIIPQLARSAGDRLRRLGHTNITVRVGDGYSGGQKRPHSMGLSSPRQPVTSLHRCCNNSSPTAGWSSQLAHHWVNSTSLLCSVVLMAE